MKNLCRAFLLALALPSSAWAGWASLGAMPAPQRDGPKLTWKSPQGVLAVSVLSPEVVRVRFLPRSEFGRDHSYAVVGTMPGDPKASFDVQAAQSVIRTSALAVTVKHDPLRIAFATAAGESLDEDDPSRGIGFVDETIRVWKRLRDDEFVYGLGEKTGRLNKRGRNLGGYSYVMWNSDTYAYGDDTDPIYATFPFYIVMRKGRAHGIFFDNTHRSLFEIGRESQRLLSFGAEGGELDYYFIDGPTPRQVVERYAELTGRMPMPPRWSLGYNQCRYSYYPESRVRLLAENFRNKKIPADVIWLDIHYLDGFNPFTWDKERFPNPAGLIGDLGKQGFKVVTILDAHPKKQPGWDVYDTGLAGDHYVKNPDGSVYTANVWPANAEKNPGPSVFPDFSKPGARDWWGGLYKKLTDVGVAGIWNDMNEPAVFTDTPDHTMPFDVRHHGEGVPTDHLEIHNVYGQLMTRSTYEGLRKIRPDHRPFVLTRATFSGGQRWSAIWPGDNVSDWDDFRATIPMFSNMGLSGFPFVGADIGGFAEAPTPELFTRWLQAGVFYPFMRTHTTFGTPEQEPWSYGTRLEDVNRRAIELRYQLLPHLYNLFEEASRTGSPIFRPLLYEYPDDPNTYERDDEFLWGRDVLVAPVLREGVVDREVYLPKGDWYDFWTATRIEGGRGIRVPVTIDTVPVFVRAGAFVFRQPVVQHTGEMPGQPLIVSAFPAPRSEATLYEDDGESFAHEKGAFSRRRFEQQRDAAGVRIRVAAPEGPYRPAARDLIVQLPGTAAKRVLVDGAEVAALKPGDEKGAGWRLVDGGVSVRLKDRFAAVEVRAEF
jgi:alpha-glucosidase